MAGYNFEEILQHLKEKKTLQIVQCDAWLFVYVKLALISVWSTAIGSFLDILSRFHGVSTVLADVKRGLVLIC